MYGQRRFESVRTPAPIIPYPAGRHFWGRALPGTSCQHVFSVISQSSSSSSSFSVGRAVSQDGIALDGEGNRREVRLALTTRTTAENDDDEAETDNSLLTTDNYLPTTA